MKIKYSSFLKYVLVLVTVCFIVMGNTNLLSRLIITEIRNEVIPYLEQENYSFNLVLQEMVPCYSVEYDNSSDYKDKSCFNTTKATSTDAIDNQQMDIACEEEYDNTELTNNTTEEELMETVVITPIDSNNIGINYSPEQLTNFEFLMSNCYTVDGSTSVTVNDINVDTLLSNDLTIDLNSDDYKVLIYHTHGSETFVNSRPGCTEDTIIGVGDELTRILEEDYGIKTYHDRTVYDMVDGKLDRNNAYTQSGYGVDKILETYPSIEVILDIHRDGVSDEVHLMKVIDGKPTAQIMFFNGISRLNDEGDLGYLNNPNLSDNLSFSLQMHLKGKAMYGDLMRKIYIGGYCYNLDRRPRASLIEVGAQTNTVEEAKNAMIPLGAILYSVLSN